LCGGRQGCPISPVLFNISIDKVIKEWQHKIKQNVMIKNLILNTILFADDQVIVTSTEDDVQRAGNALNSVAMKYNLKIAVNKTKKMALKGNVNVRQKIVLNNNIIEQENSLIYSGYTIAVTNKNLEIKLSRFHQMCGTIRRTLNKKNKKKDTKFYKFMAVLHSLMDRK
jgi:hypothetical protein